MTAAHILFCISLLNKKRSFHNNKYLKLCFFISQLFLLISNEVNGDQKETFVEVFCFSDFTSEVYSDFTPEQQFHVSMRSQLHLKLCSDTKVFNQKITLKIVQYSELWKSNIWDLKKKKFHLGCYEKNAISTLVQRPVVLRHDK